MMGQDFGLRRRHNNPYILASLPMSRPGSDTCSRWTHRPHTDIYGSEWVENGLCLTVENFNSGQMKRTLSLHFPI